MDIIREKWDDILYTVKTEYEMSDISFKTWLKPLTIHQVDNDAHLVTIIVPTEQMGVDYINRKYMFPLKVAIAETTGIEYDIQFILPGDIEEEENQDSSLSGRLQTDPAADKRANLNAKYTFDTFVVGSNNKFAHAAALAVAESPGKMYNPLFIYGGAGLGKTHLMHSIAHFILDQTPSKKVLYVTSEIFTNELIDAIRNGNNSAISSFREKYRNVDVLLIDDIQFIKGKEATQEEFFHTFNDLHRFNRQIIISSDKPPREIETLEERLRSRFEWGLLADIGAPDYETRMAILRRKEETEGFHFDDKVIEYIAANIRSNIRELESALNKLIALRKLENKQITIELAEEAVKDIISPAQDRPITADLILNTVAEHFQLQPGDIIGKKKSNNIVIPRHIVMYLCRYLIDMPFKAIGDYLGKRDHSTVINGVNNIEKEISSSQNMKNTVDTIRKKINPNL